MSDLREWLRSQNLEQYADAFAANDIDLDILAELSDRDLAELGISLGNRRRLLKAIGARFAAAAASGPVTAEPAAAAPERRRVTVLFCDLAGSTEMSRDFDPELLGPLIRRYQDAAAGAIGRFGGFVAKFMGDGVLAYFGFPRAFEDAAERAVHAALAILAEIGGIARPDGVPFTARIGIATGLVVVGEIVGAGVAQEQSIIGETPNLAARLQTLAAAGTVLVSEATMRLLGGIFELASYGEHQLKGFAQPLPVWRVCGEAATESRFAAVRAGGHLPLVGRAHEMALLLDRWRLARSGEGQIVTVSGEAGIGKSRLIAALQETLAGEPYTRVHLQCSPYYSESALHPVIRHLVRAAGFAAGDPPDVRLDKLGTLFAARAVTDAAAIPLLAELLSIEGAPPVPPSLFPAQRAAATVAVLSDEIIRLAKAAPVLLVVEDAHWIDATTVEFLTRLTDGAGAVPVMTIVTARPDFAPPWSARPNAGLLTLGRLGRSDCAALVGAVARARGLPADTVATIVARTDGVPLFVEELTKSIIEAAGDDGAAVPATLSDSLMARLDRLGPARELAQIAAVIGRQFGLPLLAAVAPQRGAALDNALSRLVGAGIVLPEGRGLEQSFGFKHALVRDAAYESLLLARRRHWHGEIAEALERQFADDAAREPDLLAHHFAEAGMAARASEYHERAGERAAARSSYREAISHYSAGLKETEGLPAGLERQRRQLSLLLKLGPALFIEAGGRSAELAQTYRRAAELGDALDDDAAAYKAKWGLWLNATMTRQMAAARDKADELVALARRSGDADLLLEAHHCRWATAFFRGDVADARRFSGIGADDYDIDRHRHLGPDFGGHDPGVCACTIVGLTSILADRAEDGRHWSNKAIVLAETLDNPFSLGHAVFNAAMMHQIGGEQAEAAEMAERALAVCDKYGFPPYRAGMRMLMAWGRGTAASQTIELIETEAEEITAISSVPQQLLGVGAELMLAAGRYDGAMALIDRALAAYEEPGVGYYLAELWRLRGRCLLALDRGNKDAARRAFAKARDLARSQRALLFERRAAALLAELDL